MNNHDLSVGEMLDPEDDAKIGLTGRAAELQFVRLAAAYNEQKAEIARLRKALSEKEELLLDMSGFGAES
jgi:hypothetical protein